VNAYTGLHAAVYDEIYADKQYAAEARFVHELTDAPGGRLLDVACGTGRHAIAFTALGYEVTGSDINEELLAVGRAAAGNHVRCVAGDMRDLHVDGGPFDLVTCLFDSIGYAQDNEGVIAALRSLSRHAAPGKFVVCEVLHAAGVLCASSATRVGRWTLNDGRTLLRTSETVLDVEYMLMQVQYELLAIDGDGRVERTQEFHTNRFFTAPELRLLATAAGLETRAIVPAYRGGSIDADTFHLMLVATPAT
jgi:ubiquinone/menaquinone biosynthesis C-methylase UbiE